VNKKILWVYGCQENSGFACNSREFITALNKNGIETRFPTGGLKTYPGQELMKQYEAPAGYEFDLCVQNVACTSFRPIKGKFNVLMTVNETDRFTKGFEKYCNMADEVWTVSEYCKKALVYSGVIKPIKVFHMPMDCDGIMELKNRPPYVQPDMIDFLFFANSEWIPRKGWDLLLDSFFNVFANNPNIGLLIKSFSYSGTENATSAVNLVKKYKEKYKAKCNVLVVFNEISLEEVRTLYHISDCFVLPSRGEGCGIGYLEAQACGVPIIVPNKGGQVDYLIPDLSYEINCKYVPVPSELSTQQYGQDMIWLEPDKEQLKYQMINVMTNYDAAKYAFASLDFKDKFGHEGTEMKKLVKYISERKF
jgi:hypothetical protein